MRRLLIAVIGAAVVAASAALAGAQPPEQELAGNFALAGARSFDEFPLSYLGETFADLPLAAVYRIDDPPYEGESIRRDDVTFVYGSCTPQADAGCLPPLQVQNWNACQRAHGVYPGPPDETMTIGGRPGAFYEGGGRLELAAGATTIVLYAADPKLLQAAARGLRGLNRARGKPCRARG